MPHDADGTEFVYVRVQASIVPADTVDHTEFNGENPLQGRNVDDQIGSGDHGLTVIFPELREVDGFYARLDNGLQTPRIVASSGDTTNGRDGTWTTRIADYAASFDGDPIDEYREDIVSLAVSNVRGFRFTKNFSGLAGRTEWLRLFHVYGEISAGETPDRLLWIDEITGLEFNLPIDLVHVRRSGGRVRCDQLGHSFARIRSELGAHNDQADSPGFGSARSPRGSRVRLG
jgi:hypothetical protein